MLRQRPINTIPGIVKIPHTCSVIHRPADELVQRDRLLQMRQHRAEPDQLTLALHPPRGALHLNTEQPRGQIPEPGRVEPRDDVVGADDSEV